ncbi:putative toxin-antitoxin system toxin component, PIN family (plasmid) [Cyanobacterium sp. IPPAS B-1200]|uniref:putative toxin-antitoxin system toxin component, PIN family n=1 Tax=Cyanobacterium sp. IPPAS B-1200 TaxID=1562720 RepID=UPI0008524A78|nr:putative toxin-antitoxin system toxin component, PIN family [Cyanobacterium sp. IPPAS B-1200]OEJ80017.1 hypothetical protein A5482_07730 [Cyanobacterium sp. IPPAS B-1200]
MIKVVIDTNIFVSALLFENSLPFQVVKLAEKKGIILFSEATLGELKEVLSRKKFDKYITAEEIVTGDNDLLVLNPFENIPIIKPDVFINSYQ